MTKLLLIIIGFAFVFAVWSCRNMAQAVNTEAMSNTSITKLQLPDRWLDESEGFESVEQIEVRKIPNSDGDEFFLRALPNGDNFYWHEVDPKMPKTRYGKNVFAVNTSSGLRVRAATQPEWDSASRIASKPRRVFHDGQDKASGDIRYRQKSYAKVGKYWGQGLLSPSGKWLAVFSYNGEDPRPSLFTFLGGGAPPIGDVFWQIYDTVTGERVFEWEARNVKAPTFLDGPAVWLEDRYFLFPEDQPAHNLIVVNLPAVTPENPVTVQFPSRKDVPAAARQEVWIPLVPLTKEQAAKLTAPYDTEISAVRLLAGELLLELKEETENRRVDRSRQKDGAGEYHFKVVSTYYYAISLDHPAQTRFASKEEWSRGKNIRSEHTKEPSDPVTETVKGTAPPYRQFPKSGTTWGSPPLLSAREWIAIFSHSKEQMFVDVYDQRLGDKLSSTTLPSTGTPDEAFKGALWIEDDYILLPLNASFDSFAFWQLPGGV